jgi:hypothetical protein
LNEGSGCQVLALLTRSFGQKALKKFDTFTVPTKGRERQVASTDRKLR